MLFVVVHECLLLRIKIVKGSASIVKIHCGEKMSIVDDGIRTSLYCQMKKSCNILQSHPYQKLHQLYGYFVLIDELL